MRLNASGNREAREKVKKGTDYVLRITFGSGASASSASASESA